MSANKRKRRIFQRMLLIFSLTSLFTVGLLLFFISKYYTNIKVDAVLQETKAVSESQLVAVDRKEAALVAMTQEIYKNSDLMNDVQIAMTHDYADYIRQNIDNYYARQGFYSVDLQSFLRSYFTYDEDVIAVQLVSGDKEFTYTFPTNYGKWQPFFEKYGEKKLLQSISRKENVFRLGESLVFKQVINDPSTLQPLGTVLMYTDPGFLGDLIPNNKSASTFAVLNREKATLYSNHTLPDIKSENMENGYRHGSSYIQTTEEQASGVFGQVVIPESQIGGIPVLQWTLFGVGVGLVLISIAVNFFISRRYSNRIQVIIDGMDQMEKGELRAKLPVDEREDELTLISQSFNKMGDSLNDYIKQVYTLEIEEQKAQLKALQGQVEPHFLYNSLEAIRMHARLEGAKVTSNMIYHLSTLLRYTADNIEMVTLADEVNYVRQYLQFMELRYQQEVPFFLEVEEPLLEHPFLKFTLQPLVENFFKYARHEEKRTSLTFSAKRVGGVLEVRMRDDGLGITEDKMREIQSDLADEKSEQGRIGLVNIHRRIQLYFGEQYGLAITSIEGQGTEVTLRVPYTSQGRKNYVENAFSR
ncbi:sensor histidine kinase [Listeria newyorkensis]|uniref:Sensor histidine kinase n=1 Tax=Listeria newyorkensis TaxID=1497681 RepID=A0A841Z2R8_9LIST|nr:sensor histidine kinase [Listeria newyorkensis]MBC1459147.1 sensor histidine kinase [Listeria newyorkensis]